MRACKSVFCLVRSAALLVSPVCCCWSCLSAASESLTSLSLSAICLSLSRFWVWACSSLACSSVIWSGRTCWLGVCGWVTRLVAGWDLSLAISLSRSSICASLSASFRSASCCVLANWSLVRRSLVLSVLSWSKARSLESAVLRAASSWTESVVICALAESSSAASEPGGVTERSWLMRLCISVSFFFNVPDSSLSFLNCSCCSMIVPSLSLTIDSFSFSFLSSFSIWSSKIFFLCSGTSCLTSSCSDCLFFKTITSSWRSLIWESLESSNFFSSTSFSLTKFKFILAAWSSFFSSSLASSGWFWACLMSSDCSSLIFLSLSDNMPSSFLSWSFRRWFSSASSVSFLGEVVESLGDLASWTERLSICSLRSLTLDFNWLFSLIESLSSSFSLWIWVSALLSEAIEGIGEVDLEAFFSSWFIENNWSFKSSIFFFISLFSWFIEKSWSLSCSMDFFMSRFSWSAWKSWSFSSVRVRFISLFSCLSRSSSLSSVIPCFEPVAFNRSFSVVRVRIWVRSDSIVLDWSGCSEALASIPEVRLNSWFISSEFLDLSFSSSSLSRLSEDLSRRDFSASCSSFSNCWFSFSLMPILEFRWVISVLKSSIWSSSRCILLIFLSSSSTFDWVSLSLVFDDLRVASNSLISFSRASRFSWDLFRSDVRYSICVSSRLFLACKSKMVPSFARSLSLICLFSVLRLSWAFFHLETSLRASLSLYCSSSLSPDSFAIWDSRLLWFAGAGFTGPTPVPCFLTDLSSRSTWSYLPLK